MDWTYLAELLIAFALVIEDDPRVTAAGPIIGVREHGLCRQHSRLWRRAGGGREGQAVV